MLGRNDLQVGHIDQRETDIPQRHSAWHRDREAPSFGQPDPVRGFAAAPQFDRRSGIADDRPNHVEADAGLRALMPSVSPMAGETCPGGTRI